MTEPILMGIARKTIFLKEDDEYVQQGYPHNKWFRTNWHAQLPPPYNNRRPSSRIVVIGGQPGTGKSVDSNVYAWNIAVRLKELDGLSRPIVVWDHGGRDKAYWALPNRDVKKKLPPGAVPEGIHGVYLYCQVLENGVPKGRPKRAYERIYMPCIKKYSADQFVNMGFTEAQANNLAVLVRKQHVTSFEGLYREIRLLRWREDYKNMLIRDVQRELENRGCWRFDRKYELPFRLFIKYGFNMIVSFGDDETVAKAELDWFWKKLRHTIDVHGKCFAIPRPVIIVEEAQEIFDVNSPRMIKVFEDFVKKLRKLQVSVVVIFPSLRKVSPDVLGLARDYVFGMMDTESVEIAVKFMGNKSLQYVLSSLWSDTTGRVPRNDRLVYSKDWGRGYLVDPFDCPQGRNRVI